MPLLDLRNALDFRNNGNGNGNGSGEKSNDHHLRDFRRMSGAVQVLDSGKGVPGPYTQDSREKWLRKLLEAQTHIRQSGPPDVAGLELITHDELREIRRIWVVDKHELEDTLPDLYEEVTGEKYPGESLDDDLVLGAAEMEQLQEVCGDDRLHYELSRELLSMTRQQRSKAKRAGLFTQLEKSFGRHFYDSKEDALDRARAVKKERDERNEKKSDACAISRELPLEEEKG